MRDASARSGKLSNAKNLIHGYNCERIFLTLLIPYMQKGAEINRRALNMIIGKNLFTEFTHFAEVSEVRGNNQIFAS
jgi:hypothetical protein